MSTIGRNSIGRPPLKQRQILAHLHDRIVNGDLGPLMRLPTRRDLAEKFDASPVTVQQAFDHLMRSGFIESRGGKGTFVVANPPHLSHYAMVFPHLPDHPEWSRFWTALSNEGRRIHGNENSPRTLSIWYGIDGHEDREDFRRLVADVRAHRLAGLIFATPPVLVKNTPLVDEPGIARVAIMAESNDLPSIPRVEVDGLSFMTKALDALAHQKKKRVAVILPPQLSVNASWNEQFNAGLRRNGMETRPYWRIEANQSVPRTTRACARLLMLLPPEERPNAILVHDDNLVEQATTGLIDAGARVPQDVAVVAHCNFPWPTPSAVPVSRLGYDAREVVRACISIIDEQRRGEKSPHVTKINAVFEDELPDLHPGAE
jgi:DNA-binding LacI/PurR family transcriptional regulator